MCEIWKSIADYEGLYEVSNKGNVRSIRRNAVLNQTTGVKNGYRYVGLYKDGKNKKALVHRLVASAFIDNPMGKKTVNHIDGNKGNNAIDNLEWATHSENHRHAFATGLKVASEKQREAARQTGKRTCDLNRPRKAVAMIENGVVKRVFVSAHEAARTVKGSPSAIIACCRGKAKSCKGYGWKYAD